jgi:hypothetical protein
VPSDRVFTGETAFRPRTFASSASEGSASRCVFDLAASSPSPIVFREFMDDRSDTRKRPRQRRLSGVLGSSVGRGCNGAVWASWLSVPIRNEAVSPTTARPLFGGSQKQNREEEPVLAPISDGLPSPAKWPRSKPPLTVMVPVRPPNSTVALRHRPFLACSDGGRRRASRIELDPALTNALDLALDAHFLLLKVAVRDHLR